jgi:hypothetical protein
MGKLILYQAAVLWHPDENNEEQYQKEKTKVLIEPHFLLAKNDKSAAYKLSKQIPEEYLEEIDQVEILVRPF